MQLCISMGGHVHPPVGPSVGSCPKLFSYDVVFEAKKLANVICNNAMIKWKTKLLHLIYPAVGVFIFAKVSVAAYSPIELFESKFNREWWKPQLSTISRSSVHIFAKNDSLRSFYVSQEQYGNFLQKETNDFLAKIESRKSYLRSCQAKWEIWRKK